MAAAPPLLTPALFGPKRGGGIAGSENEERLITFQAFYSFMSRGHGEFLGHQNNPIPDDKILPITQFLPARKEKTLPYLKNREKEL